MTPPPRVVGCGLQDSSHMSIDKWPNSPVVTVLDDGRACRQLLATCKGPHLQLIWAGNDADYEHSHFGLQAPTPIRGCKPKPEKIWKPFLNRYLQQHRFLLIAHGTDRK